MRVALVTLTIQVGGTGVLASREPEENPRTNHFLVPIRSMKSIDHVDPSKVATATLEIERLDSFKFNTMKITIGASLPCRRDELLDQTAHNELADVIAEQMHMQYLDEGALLHTWTDSIIQLVDVRGERR